MSTALGSPFSSTIKNLPPTSFKMSVIFLSSINFQFSISNLSHSDLGALADDLLGNVFRHFLIVGEFHGIGCLPLGYAADGGGIAKHFPERHVSINDLFPEAVRHVFDLAAFGRDVADDVAHELFRGDDFDFHDRLKKHWVSSAHAFLKSFAGRDFESDFRRVDFMVAAVIERHPEINNREPGDDAVVRGFHDAFFYRPDVFARDHAAHHLRQKLAAFAWFLRLESQSDMAILAAATGLADIFTFDLHSLAESFF